MFGSLGGPEILLIFVVALIVFGPKKLPEIGRTVGGMVRELRRATGEFRSSVEREIGLDPLEGLERARRGRRDILSTVSDPIREVTQGAIGIAREARLEVEDDVPAGGKPASAAEHSAAGSRHRAATEQAATTVRHGPATDDGAALAKHGPAADPAATVRSSPAVTGHAPAAAGRTPAEEPTTAATEKLSGPAGGEPGE